MYTQCLITYDLTITVTENWTSVRFVTPTNSTVVFVRYGAFLTLVASQFEALTNLLCYEVFVASLTQQ